MTLERYRGRRDFRKSGEPIGGEGAGGEGLFVVQKHAARRLHFDLRLELDGVLKSWAVPRGPSFNPDEKRLAVQVEDHPLEYGAFEGVIPEREYGAGAVQVWDRGRWTPQEEPHEALRKGHLRFRLAGERLRGGWDLIRMGGSGREGRENWLLLKQVDEFAGGPELAGRDLPSVLSGRTIDEIRAAREALWHPDQPPVTVETPAPTSPLPAWLPPQLAVPVESPPAGEGWIHEIKLDGYRTLCRISAGRATLLTRTGLDWSARFSSVATAVERLPLREGWLDGEIAVLLEDGTTSFPALQELLSEGRQEGLIYFLFDLLAQDGEDLRPLPLLARKARLAALLSGVGEAPLHYCEHVEGDGPLAFREACALGLEGVVSKRSDAPYRPGRSSDWRKSKCLLRQEFVVGGHTSPRGERVGFGSLLLGYYEGERLRYAGRVGTGFTDRSLRQLRELLAQLTSPDSPFADPVPTMSSGEQLHWTRPELVAEVAFAGWTRDRLLRQASFQGLREEKPPREVVREESGQVEERPPTLPPPGPVVARLVASRRLTNPDKVLYPGIGVTKRQLAEYYELVAARMLPELSNRPLTLFRCPEGAHQECFFQKHGSGTIPPEVMHVAIAEREGIESHLVVRDLAGLLGLVQMGVLEIHVWGARADRPEAPDRLVFDLDPGEGVPWEAVAVGALAVHLRLKALGLESLLKATGGKGLHVVVPLARRHNWEQLSRFARGMAEAMEREEPQSYTARMAKRLRPGKIFIDYLRNARGATAICLYSTRARPGAPLAVPLAWEELGQGIRSDTFTLGNIVARIENQREEPWRELIGMRQVITTRMLREVGVK